MAKKTTKKEEKPAPVESEGSDFENRGEEEGARAPRRGKDAPPKDDGEIRDEGAETADEPGAETDEPYDRPPVREETREEPRREEPRREEPRRADPPAPPKVEAKADRFAEARAKLDEYVKKQHQLLKIEPEGALDPHFRTHSENLLLATKRAAQAQDRARTVKDSLDRLMAEVDFEIRGKADKTTEDAMKKAVARDPRIIGQKESLAFTEYQADVYKGVVEAFKHKRDMLVQLGSNYRAELGHDPSIRGDRRPPADREPSRSSAALEDNPPLRSSRSEPPRRERDDDRRPARDDDRRDTRPRDDDRRPAARDDDRRPARDDRRVRDDDDHFDDAPPRAARSVRRDDDFNEI